MDKKNGGDMKLLGSLFGIIRGPKVVIDESSKLPKGMALRTVEKSKKSDLRALQDEISSNLPEWDKEFFSKVLD